MKFAFYDSLTEPAQTLIREVFKGKGTTAKDAGRNWTVDRKGKTIFFSDGILPSVVIDIPQWVRGGFNSKKAWEGKHD